METVIVKVQRPFFDDDHLVFVYTKDRSIMQHLPFDGPIKVALGDQLKAYFEAKLHKDGTLGLVRQVKAKW